MRARRRRRSITPSSRPIMSRSSRSRASGKIPIVRQYRPALEGIRWELPAGLVEPGEDPAESCRRELLEETGLTARAIHASGRELSLHRPSQQPHPLVLRRSRRAHRRLRAGAGHRGEAGFAGGDRAADQGRRFRLAAPSRHPAARRAARVSGAAADASERRRASASRTPATSRGVPAERARFEVRERPCRSDAPRRARARGMLGDALGRAPEISAPALRCPSPRSQIATTSSVSSQVR